MRQNESFTIFFFMLCVAAKTAPGSSAHTNQIGIHEEKTRQQYCLYDDTHARTDSHLHNPHTHREVHTDTIYRNRILCMPILVQN